MAQKNVSEPSDKLLPRLSLFFFSRPWFTISVWLVLVVFGALCYTTLLKREGFPSINIPLVIVSGTYAQDSAGVDATVAKPLSDIALKQPGVSTVNTTSQDNFVQATVMYDETVKPDDAKRALEKAVMESGQLPEGAKLTYAALLVTDR